MPLVLASASPRRQELLKDAGIEFVVKPANIPEVRRDQESAQVFAERMARERAESLRKRSRKEWRAKKRKQFLLEPIKRSTS